MSALIDKVLGDLTPKLGFGKVEKTDNGLKITIPIETLIEQFKQKLEPKYLGIIDMKTEGNNIVVYVKVM